VKNLGEGEPHGMLCKKMDGYASWMKREGLCTSVVVGSDIDPVDMGPLSSRTDTLFTPAFTSRSFLYIGSDNPYGICKARIVFNIKCLKKCSHV